jgi:hypothetical protein
MRNYMVLVWCLFLVGCTSFRSVRGGDEVQVTHRPAILPSMIIAYNFALVDYEDFKWLWEPTGKRQNGHPFLKLGSQFAKLSGDIDVAFAFTKVACIVHNDIEGQVSGFADPSDGGKDSDFRQVCFITTKNIEIYFTAGFCISSKIARILAFPFNMCFSIDLISKGRS